MAEHSAVDRAQMQIAANKVESAAQTIQGIQSKLQGHKTELRSGWDGKAAMKFEQVFNAWDADFRKVLQALEGMHEKLTHTRIQYESTEDEQERAAAKIDSLLNGTT
ncbi:MAG TPA: WXG100 family type VII secretion target [Mycobacteriales bacterium]|nr:WXG100 family type VII secretion target [Mycobacteriales bacterium]